MKLITVLYLLLNICYSDDQTEVSGRDRWRSGLPETESYNDMFHRNIADTQYSESLSRFPVTAPLSFPNWGQSANESRQNQFKQKTL